MARVLREKFPRASAIKVVDISGTGSAPCSPPLPRALHASRLSLDPPQGSGRGDTKGPLLKRFTFAGGCGAMYEIHIESEEFREKRTVQQHQMVNQVRGARGRPRWGTVCVFMCVCERV